MDKENKFSYKVGDIDEVIDERGNTVILLRSVSWNEKPEKLELRKWILSMDESGSSSEKPNKGFSFLTEDGPHNLVNVLIRKGFGKTEKVLNELKDRDDFELALVNVVGKKKLDKAKDTESSNFYDPREMLL